MKNRILFQRTNLSLSISLIYMYLFLTLCLSRSLNGVSLATSARTVDRLPWQPSDETTVAQGGWTCRLARLNRQSQKSVHARMRNRTCVFAIILFSVSLSLSLSRIVNFLTHIYCTCSACFVSLLNPQIHGTDIPLGGLTSDTME